MRLFQSADVQALTGLSRSQLREWTGRDRRFLVPPDVDPQGPGRVALFTWQTVLSLRILRQLQVDFAVDIGAWAPGVSAFRVLIDGLPFQALWGSVVYFSNRANPELLEKGDTPPKSGLLLPLDQHLLVLSTEMSIQAPEQRELFAAVALKS